MIEEAMSITLIIFVLVILLFGFDSAGHVKTRRNTITANGRTRDVRVLKSRRRLISTTSTSLWLTNSLNPAPSIKSGVFLISCLADQPRCHKSDNQDGQRTEHDESER